MRIALCVIAIGYAFSFFVGCSNKMPPLRPPKYKPAAVAQAALEQYDIDSDGVVDRKELNAAPGLSFSAERIDADANGGITAEELETFVQEKWLDAGAGGIRIKCVVNMDGRPLANANVSFEPEEFLGGVVGTATGKTSDQGFTPMNDSSIEQGGVKPGLYLVRITTDDGNVPSKYNTETTLGVEVARRASYMPRAVEFNLRSR